MHTESVLPTHPSLVRPAASQRRVLALPLLAALALLVVACEEPGDAPPAAARFQVIAGASEAVAIETCENFGTTGEADVYHMVELLDAAVEDESFELLNDSTWRLIQLGLDERTHLGLASTNAYVDAEDGHQVMFAIDAYENDVSGPSVEDSRAIVWEYDARRDCWWQTHEGETSLEAPCTSVPVGVWHTAYDFFYVHDEAEYCSVRFRIYTSFTRVAPPE